MKNNMSTIQVFLLEEQDNKVIATIESNTDIGIKYIFHDMPKVRIRSPKPKKENLKKMALASSNSGHNSSDREFLEHFKDCRENEIIKEVQEIRKSLKRIQSYENTKKLIDEIILEL